MADTGEGDDEFQFLRTVSQPLFKLALNLKEKSKLVDPEDLFV